MTLIWQAKSTTKSKKEYTYNMGAVQGSITKAAGAIAIAAKGIGEEKDKSIEQGEKALVDKANLNTEIEGYNNDEGQKQLDADNAEIAYKAAAKTAEDVMADPKASGIDKINAAAAAEEKKTDMEMAKKALTELREKRTAAISRLERTNKIIERGRSWGGNY